MRELTGKVVVAGIGSGHRTSSWPTRFEISALVIAGAPVEVAAVALLP